MKKQRVIKMGAISYAKMIRLMLEGEYSCEELADLTGLHYVTVLQYTRELHLAGAAHISEWRKDRLDRDNVRIYKIGHSFDMPRFRLSHKERQRRYKARKKAEAV